MSFVKNMDKNISKSMSGKYIQKLLENAKKSTTDALKTSSKKSHLKNSRSDCCFDWQ